MISALIILFFMIVFGISLDKCNSQDVILNALLGAGIGLNLVFAISGVIATVAPVETVLLKEIEIYAFQDKSPMYGSFFLGSGYVKNKQRYYFLCKNENGFKMDSVSARSVYLNTSNKPRIEVCGYRFKNEFLRKNFMVLKDSFYKVYIPEGSIKYDFNVDLR